MGSSVMVLYTSNQVMFENFLLREVMRNWAKRKCKYKIAHQQYAGATIVYEVDAVWYYLGILG